MEPQPKYREKVLIGLESAPPSFDVRSKVMGPGGANLQYITNETGAIVTIRGKGSGFIEPATGHESVEPLHICVEHSKYEVLQAGRQLAFNLIETVQQEWSDLQQQQHQQQQQQQQQQTAESQQQGTVQQQHVQAIPVHNQLSSTASVQAAQGQETVLPSSGNSLQLQLPIFTPPPSLAVPPPPIHLAQAQPIQVSVSNTSGGQGHQTTVSTGSTQATQDATSQQAIVQQPTALQPTDIQHQIQIQPQQVYVSQGGGVIQPATIIPQQQIQQTSILAHQPQIITQSYPIQYVQASNGQMVVAYPNIVRPVATDNNSAQQPQVMLVQYAPQRPLLHGRTTTQSHTVPQIVQIVNPQTGQVQHVLQHIQPQIQMQQLALATNAGQVSGGTVVGGQVLMPLQQSNQQQQILATQQDGQQIQFAAQHAQGMIITSQPHQVTVSQASLQQAERGNHQVVQQQVLRPGQGVKRRFDSGPAPSNQAPPPSYLAIPPPQSMPPPTMTLQAVRKGIGSEGLQQQQQSIRPSQQAQQQQHIQHQQLLQHQQQQQQQQQQAAQQMIQQHQQQVQVVHQSTIDESQQIDEKTIQQTLQSDDWRLQQQQQQPQHQQQRPQYVQIQTPNSPSSNSENPNEGRMKGQMEMNKQQASYAYQQQAQTKQQQLQQFGATGAPADAYGQQSYSTQGYPLYQQPPPASFQQQQASAYNSWLMPQQ
ncbi:unnamed protein product [Nezara viridula]|uniref:KH homology domain-containing protein 4 n=1 Tax=Nezara viridula TaxID=85310 RepID=A0A9P0H9C3_NEZVI|nr:unnamed protein product [Nezara viridula]